MANSLSKPQPVRTIIALVLIAIGTGVIFVIDRIGGIIWKITGRR